MAEDGIRKVSHNTVVLSQLDDSKEILHLLSNLLVEAFYLYIQVPFQATHVLTVNICVVPFCIPRHRGQIFYHAEAFYTQCCQGISRKDFMPTIASTAQRIYSIYISHHTWYFNVADAWQQLQVPVAVLQQNLTCSEKSDVILSHFVSPTKRSPGVEETSRPIPFRTLPDFYSNQHSFSDETPERMSSSISHQQLIRHSKINRSTQNKQGFKVTNVAEKFLASFRNMNFATKLQAPLNLSETGVPQTKFSEPVTQAFRCCKSMALQANEQLKYATFTRFVSLCFFLIWEVLACEPGKAGARVINAKMKEAGFKGTSRSLKTLRDETIFINQLVASVEAEYGIGVASLVLYHIFDSSNYHLIRLMNRYSTTKKRLAIERICECLDANKLRRVSLPVLQIHKLIQEHMPNLDNSEISRAIGYSKVCRTMAKEHDSQYFDLHHKRACCNAQE